MVYISCTIVISCPRSGSDARSVLELGVDLPAEDLSVEAAGEEVTDGVVLPPRHATHHLTVALKHI